MHGHQKLDQYSSEDFEKLWFLYKLNGQSKNISIEGFCLQQGVSYTAFSKWFSSRKKRIVPVEIVGMPSAHALAESDVLAVSLPSEVNIPSVMPITSVVVSLSNGIQISKSHLSYRELSCLVEQLNERSVRMLVYEKHSFNVHTRTFAKGYRFMKIRVEEDKNVYRVDLSSEFLSLEYPRRRKNHSLEEILMGDLSLFLFEQGSRNSINNTLGGVSCHHRCPSLRFDHFY